MDSGCYVLVKDAKTSEKYGCLPENRPADELISYGVVNLDKPRGPTSHQAVDYLKKILGISKAGHSGTLDPNVTGVLPVATGRATRIVQAILPAGKEYVALMHVHKSADEQKIRDVCQGFVGKIKQLPPVKSSIKRQERFRNVYCLEILEFGGNDVLFRVGTQAGTYIRKLIHDIGVALGTGAHMQELRRTRAGPFEESTALTLQEVADAMHYYNEGNEAPLRKAIMPMETAVSHLPKAWVLDTTVDTLCHGASLKVPGIARIEKRVKKGDAIAVMTLKNELVCLAAASMDATDVTEKRRGMAAVTAKVFMKCRTYPKVEVGR